MGSEKKVVIKKGIEVIGQGCFSSCEFLQDVVFEKGTRLRQLEPCGFDGSGLKKVTIPSGVEEVGRCCFFMCEDLREVRFECKDGRVPVLGTDAFSGTRVKIVRIPRGVQFEIKGCRMEYFDKKIDRTYSKSSFSLL
jgi:hypothetical protein